MPSVRNSDSASSPAEPLNRPLFPASSLAVEMQPPAATVRRQGTLRRRSDVGGTALGGERCFRLRFVQ
jgi:hypothetical protein